MNKKYLVEKTEVENTFKVTHFQEMVSEEGNNVWVNIGTNDIKLDSLLTKVEDLKEENIAIKVDQEKVMKGQEDYLLELETIAQEITKVIAE